MRYSRMLIPTVKEAPADAEIPSHKLMLRAGLMRKLASGTYTYLPLGWRCLLKVIAIVRDEMNKAGAQEILMPSVQPIELWQQTGRDVDYGPTMARFKDRHGRLNVLAPTAEEVVTSVAAGEIKSYKQLPINLYQISFKFRDEFRPRFGVLRSREFIMKDAYSFHATPESLDKEYWNMYETYKRIFKRCGLDYVIVEAESGEMGGETSHQFTIPCPSGEDIIVYTEDGSYAANLEKAAVDPLPVIPSERSESRNLLKPELVHTPNVGSIDAVCALLKTEPKDMLKTLIYWEHDSALKDSITGYMKRIDEIKCDLDRERKQFIKASTEVAMEDSFRNEAESEARRTGAMMEANEAELKKLESMLNSDGFRKIRFSVAVVRGDHEVNAEKLRVIAGNALELASEDMIEWLTGAKVGFAGPMGLAEKGYKLIIDYAVAAMAVGVTGANKTDYHARNIIPGRDFPLEGDNVIVADIRNAVEGDTYKGKKLLFKHGIEVGQVFKLGTKYSAKLGCNFLDDSGKENPTLMGCYGIGINRIVASAIEAANDDNGIIFPISIAPFEVIIVSVNQDDAEVVKTGEDIYKQLIDKGVEVLLDDRDERAGVKFKDADLIGIPVRITVGKKALATGSVELKLRTEPKPTLIPADTAVAKTIELVNSLKQKLNA
ncbi:MAG: proline--tRNA ligase [Planctomycetota bacterium]